MRVLIVGCGYVGLPLGAELRRAGHDVSGLRRSRAAEADLRAAGIRPLVADITNPASLEALPGSFDWVVHCIAAGGGGADAYRRVYVDGTRNLLAWLSAQPPRRFVYTSSTSVYGQNDGSWVTEESPTEPAAETGGVLLETERLLLEAHHREALPVTILRLAGIYGPNRGYWLKQFVSGAATLTGDGSRFLNMIHRDDVVGAIVTALDRGRPGEIYNVADQEPVTQRDLFHWLADTLNRPMPPSVPPGDALRKRGATDKRISNRKLAEALGYPLLFPTFREGFRTVAPDLDQPTR
jgi:nucleoside-diphosphate-sugar epimerase